MDALELGEAWARVLEDLKQDEEITSTVLAFVRHVAPLAITESTLLLVAPDDLSKRMVEQRVRDQVLHRMGHHLGAELTRLAVTVDQAGADELALPVQEDHPPAPELLLVPSGDTGLVGPGTENAQPGPSEPVPPTTNRHGGAPSHRNPPAAVDAPSLNPKYTFDTFVTGSSNRFASAAASAVAEAPAAAYNPLFVYGDSGLGKTHLLHAIGHYAMNLFHEVRVRFVNSEEFTNEFINTIGQGGGTAEFHRRYRDVDILLIDDIQFLSNKEQTQEEFFHTFNALHNANKQIVITSDVAPKLLSGFEERMRSRFESGLITDIQPPDLETRIAILRKKASAEGLRVPHDVLEYIASRIATNIRELEGALIRVTAFANLNEQQVGVPLAEIVLKDVISKDDREVTPATIIAHTCAYFGLTVEDLTGPSRTRPLTTARQIAMYLCREMTPLSLPKIGAAFGGRDHTTVIHAEKKIRTLMAQKHAIYNQVTELTNRIRQNQPI